MKIACIVPARMGSSRFPGKPIVKILGHSMIEHVYRRLLTCQQVDQIVIATCDQEIKDVAESFGAKVIMTSPDHVRGTDRVAEAAKSVDADIIINVQGDEPLVNPVALDQAITWMKQHPEIPCINLISVIKDWDVFVSRDVVKTVIDGRDQVLYFSRQPIPTQPKEKFRQAIKQIGIYFFKKDFLLQFSAWPQTPLEDLEGVDMMRILEKGHVIQAFMSEDTFSVDTPQDLALSEKIIAQDPLYKKVFAT